jgi:Toprim-like
MKAKQVHIGESQWDMLALADRTDLYLNQNQAFIATRGASNAALCNALIPEGVSVLAWPQNDEAGKRWLDDLSTKVPVQVARAIVPEQFKDVNEWTKGRRECRGHLRCDFPKRVGRETGDRRAGS